MFIGEEGDGRGGRVRVGIVKRERERRVPERRAQPRMLMAWAVGM